MNTNEAKIIDRIREQYTAKEQTKLDELRDLDKKVKRPATVFAYAFGTIGALILGTGMCFAMKVIGDMMAAGILIGLAGIAMVSLTYPIFKRLLRGRKQKYAAEIMQLSDSILNA
jgi:hypothetical protein